MKNALIIIFLVFSTIASATDYYISASGNDTNTGLSTSTPWKTLAKVNSAFTNMKPGDQILFNRGDTFYGTLVISKSGSSGSPITIGAYGAGENPKITGYTALTSWTNEGGNIYSSPLNMGFYLNNVSYNGKLQPMGRYPNTGWRTFTSHSANTSITDATLTGSWTGAEVVIRKNKWVIDRHTITSGNSTTLTYTTTSDYLATPGNTQNYSPVDGNGYFIQNSLATLDTLGEWFYDSSAHKLYVYSTSTPTAVNASTIETLVSMSSITNVSFNNIDFEGANSYGFNLTSCSSIAFNSCNLTMMGGWAVYGMCNSLSFNSGSIQKSNDNGISITGTNCSVTNYTCQNIGMNAGMLWGSDGHGIAIAVTGNSTAISGTSVTNTGYNPIVFNGTNTIIENNYIDTFCSIKDDGGGIYTGGTNSSGSKIKDNIILDGIGAYEGSVGSGVSIVAAGIYCDNLGTGFEISGNTIAYSAIGINLNEANTINIHDNTLYDNVIGIRMATTAANPTHDITFRKNIIAKTNDVNVIVNNTNVVKVDNIFSYFSYPSTYFSIGSIDNNYYLAPSNDSSFLFVNRNFYNGAVLQNFAYWKKFSGSDFNTILLGIASRFEYNASQSLKTISLITPMIDVKGTKYANSITLLPFTSVILLVDPSPFKVKILTYIFDY